MTGHQEEQAPEGAAAEAEQGDAPTTGDELAELREKADTYHQNWQRAAADLINYKRRVEGERAESARLSNAALAINLLPIYDDLDRAVEAIDSTLAGLNWVQGITAIHRKFSHLLDSMGVAPIETDGAMFDPALHEAVGRQPGEDDKVLHVVQKGYRLGDRVLRPVMVIVGNGEEPAPEA